MPTYRTLRTGKTQVVIRLSNLKPIYRTFPTRKDARKFARAVEADTSLARKLAAPDQILAVEQAVQVETNTGSLSCIVPSFSDFIDEYLDSSTMADKSMVGRLKFWQKKFAHKSVIDIAPEDIDDILLHIYESVSGTTVNRYKSNLSSVFIAFNKHPTFRRLKFPNPVRSEFVSSFSENPAKTRFLSTIEQKRLLQASRASHWNRLYLLVLMALTTGARRGELSRLTWRDLDRSNKVAYLHTSKNNEPRLLPLVNPVISELADFNDKADHLIFPSTIDPFSPFDFKKAWRRALEDGGITKLRFHDLRHTAASNMVAAGRTLFETGTLLGHRQASTTMRYAHLAHQHTSKMAEDVWDEIHGDSVGD